MSDRDAIWRFAEHVAGTDYEDLPESAAVATRTFLLDTLGVGVAGSAGPWTRCLIETQRLSCPGNHARVWSHGARLSAAGAAVCNAYQIHNAEFDCVHEGAVVHTFTVPVAAALAWAEREGGVGGRDFLTALALGVDVACHLGVASTSPLRFFRTATAGAFGAAAAIGRLAGFDAATLVNAFGAVLGQLSGTMQAHVEGSPMLGMQVGLNARNAIVACDIAARALHEPRLAQEVVRLLWERKPRHEGAVQTRRPDQRTPLWEPALAHGVHRVLQLTPIALRFVAGRVHERVLVPDSSLRIHSVSSGWHPCCRRCTCAAVRPPDRFDLGPRTPNDSATGCAVSGGAASRGGLGGTDAPGAEGGGGGGVEGGARRHGCAGR